MTRIDRTEIPTIFFFIQNIIFLGEHNTLIKRRFDAIASFQSKLLKQSIKNQYQYRMVKMTEAIGIRKDSDGTWFMQIISKESAKKYPAKTNTKKPRIENS